MGEMSNVQAHGHDIGVEEVAVVVMTKLNELISMLGMVSTGARAEGLVG